MLRLTLLPDGFITVMDKSMIHAHRARSASTSLAARAGFPTDDRLKVAGWSGELTFAKYYNKPVHRDRQFDTSIH